LGKRYGTVILRKERQVFDNKVAEIQNELKQLSVAVEVELTKEIKNSREKLIEMLLPGVMKNPPQRLKSGLFGDMDEAIARKFIGKELDKKLPKANKLIGEMHLNCDYKDVTFEMLNDEAFIKAIKEKYEYNDFEKLYLEEETMGQR
jgi:hypothetical protein